MTLLLLASSQMGTTESTEDLFKTLRTGACGTTSRSTLVKPRSWWWISAGTASRTEIGGELDRLVRRASWWWETGG
ncbi:hypothetical protein L3Q82_021641 [Scortum barcoo]|uniref:Uncharacterized protein n=1 Tax=Scortum barcoo TaxID=214431 RepID=A0ACB8X4S1_9TELE|nr:hypothetical protein L3Q82_021641 [Scortum barcoo]